MSTTAAFTLEFIVLTSMVLGFGTWMLQQVKTLAPKRVTVLAKNKRS